MTKQNNVIWITGNVLFGIIGFFAYLWGLFQAWGSEGNIWLYPVGAVIIVLALFVVFNFIIISGEKAKKWVNSILLFLGATGLTVLIHGILQNTLFE